MRNFVGANQISAVNISAITGSFADLSVTGRLSANSISADVQNVKVLYENVAGDLVTHLASGSTNFDTYSLNDNALDYDVIEVICSTSGAANDAGDIFVFGAVPTANIGTSRNDLSEMNLAQYTDSNGTVYRYYVWMYVHGTNNRTFRMARAQDIAYIWLHMVIGVKQP